MNILSGIILVSEIAFVIFAGCIATQPYESHGTIQDLNRSLPEIASAYLHTYDTMQDFSASITITSPGGMTCEKVWFEKPDKYRIENTCPTENGYNLTIFDGSDLWHVKNTSQEVYLLPAESLNFTFPDEFDTTGIDTLLTVRTILDDYKNRSVTVYSTPQGNVSIIEVHNITPPVQPANHRYGDFYSAKLQIGQPAGTVKSAEFFDENNREIISVDYSDVRINSGFSNSTFSFTPHQDSTIKPVPTLVMTPVFIQSLDEAERLSQKGYFGEVHLPGYIPPGYRFSQGMSVPGSWTSFMYAASGNTNTLRIDERESIRTGENSEYWYSYDLPTTGNATPVNTGGMSGRFFESETGNQMQWIKGNISYLVTGPLDKNEMIKIAESVE